MHKNLFIAVSSKVYSKRSCSFIKFFTLVRYAMIQVCLIIAFFLMYYFLMFLSSNISYATKTINL